MFQLVGCQVSIRYTKRWQNAYHSSINIDIPPPRNLTQACILFYFASVHELLKGKTLVGPFWQHLENSHTWRPFSETQEWKGE